MIQFKLRTIRRSHPTKRRPSDLYRASSQASELESFVSVSQQLHFHLSFACAASQVMSAVRPATSKNIPSKRLNLLVPSLPFRRANINIPHSHKITHSHSNRPAPAARKPGRTPTESSLNPCPRSSWMCPQHKIYKHSTQKRYAKSRIFCAQRESIAVYWRICWRAGRAGLEVGLTAFDLYHWIRVPALCVERERERDRERVCGWYWLGRRRVEMGALLRFERDYKLVGCMQSPCEPGVCQFVCVLWNGCMYYGIA